MHILWLKTELLHPLDKGGRIRTYHVLSALRRQHQITYLTLDDGTGGADALSRAVEYCDDLIRIPFRTAQRGSLRFYAELAANLGSSLPYAVARYRSDRMRAAIIEAVRDRRPDVIVCDFLTPSVNIPEHLSVPTVLFQHNVEAAIWRRHRDVAKHAVKRRYMNQQWRRMVDYERAQTRRVDHVVAVSEEDLATFTNSYAVRSGSVTPTGVDTTFYRPRPGQCSIAGEIVFVGSLDWMPNEDAVLFFADEILPRIQRVIQNARLTIVGRRPGPAVRALAVRASGIEVTGTVPDVRPYLERAAVVVVPLRIGGGTRLKIYEAMAMERAVVSTTIGAEGLPVRHGDELLVADTPQDFADSVVSLLREPVQAAALGVRAARRVRSEFDWTHVAGAFAEICNKVRKPTQDPLGTGKAIWQRV